MFMLMLISMPFSPIYLFSSFSPCRRFCRCCRGTPLLLHFRAAASRRSAIFAIDFRYFLLIFFFARYAIFRRLLLMLYRMLFRHDAMLFDALELMLRYFIRCLMFDISCRV